MVKRGNMSNKDEIVRGIITLGNEIMPDVYNTQLFFTATAELQAEIDNELGLNGESKDKESTEPE